MRPLIVHSLDLLYLISPLNVAICLRAALSPIIMIIVIIAIIIINIICSVMCFAFLLPANANVSVFVLTATL